MTFFSFLFKKRFPNADARSRIVAGPFTPLKLLLIMLCVGLLVVVYALIITANNTLLVTVPARGGTLVEGIVGAPRAIDPLSAVTDTDAAFTRLVYAGLMKANGDGTTSPELAREYSVSPDGRTYTFALRDKLFFSDGSALTSNDISATIEALQDPAVNPRSSSYWQQVSVSAPDAMTIIATIPAADDTFLEYMTVGIMPAASLQAEESTDSGVAAAFTRIPGAGAFILDDVSFDESGAPKKLHFERNRRYALGVPLLASLDVVVYANQDALLSALSRGDIDLTFALAPETLTADKLPDNITFTAIPTNRTVALWQLPTSELSSESLRATLNRFVDKQSIIGTIENGYGISLSGAGDTESHTISLEDAQQALEKSGYTVTDGVLSKGSKQSKTPVTLSIATVNDPKLLATARSLAQSFTALGAITQVLSFDQGTLADELAEHNLPLVLSDGSFSLPGVYTQAIPLYTSATVLATDSRVHGVGTAQLDEPTLRYATVAGWHTRTDRVWPVLVRK
jgi:peptide/nickel transport system substrate-binding protein